MRLASALRAPVFVGVGLAALPIALNWRALNRKAEPEASLPRFIGTSFLEHLPLRAVLFVAGDNDSYPLWYAQQVLRARRDVTVVTIPLLAAPWYLNELERRDSLSVSAASLDVVARARGLARSATARGRPVAVALTVPAADRKQLARLWKVTGLSALAVNDQRSIGDRVPADSSTIAVDSTAARGTAEWILRNQPVGVARPAIDPVYEYFQRVLSCPRFALGLAPKIQVPALDSTCNLRVR
jgi:hypothetical protein